jgi:hypothetical protein
MKTEHPLAPLVRTLEQSALGRRSLRHWRRLRYPLDPSKPRVLCVGYVKTGTSSFGNAMRVLGFSHYGYDPDFKESLEGGDLKACLRWASHFNSLDDLPWSTPKFITAFCRHFPGSFYVMLERDEQEWLQSYFRFFGTFCSEDEALANLRTHQSQVHEILSGESHVLRMNICAGDGYEKLCPFLGIPIPDKPFPWVIPHQHTPLL